MLESIVVGNAVLFLAATATFVSVEVSEAFAGRRRFGSAKKQNISVSAQTAFMTPVVESVATQATAAQNCDGSATTLKAA